VGGVINFRGRVIPLIDARARLGAPRREPDLSTRIIVVQTSEWAAGLVVDEVVEVLPVRAEALDPPGKATAGAAAVSGVVSEGDRLILVLDRDRLLEGSVDLRLPFDLEQTREAER
jgi:purine-binding chemotaxis protein CheW